MAGFLKVRGGGRRARCSRGPSAATRSTLDEGRARGNHARAPRPQPVLWACMRSLALFARAPAAGRVKTRLAPALPAAAAAALYAGLLADAFEAGGRARTDARAACWADGAGETPPDWHACAQL